jgi:hypothetical protein
LTFYRDERKQTVSATSAKLLQAACEIIGGNRALASRLGIGETLLVKFMADERELPDPLLLRAVDIILADRESRYSLAVQPAFQSFSESPSDA